jgi:hypothetical protein
MLRRACQIGRCTTWTGADAGIRRWTACNRSAQSWLDVAGKGPIELQLTARHGRVRFSSTPRS